MQNALLRSKFTPLNLLPLNIVTPSFPLRFRLILNDLFYAHAYLDAAIGAASTTDSSSDLSSLNEEDLLAHPGLAEELEALMDLNDAVGAFDGGGGEEEESGL